MSLKRRVVRLKQSVVDLEESVASLSMALEEAHAQNDDICCERDAFRGERDALSREINAFGRERDDSIKRLSKAVTDALVLAGQYHTKTQEICNVAGCREGAPRNTFEARVKSIRDSIRAPISVNSDDSDY